ncbi:MAG: peptide chain release factor-like protein [Planctomycetota bacterium]
MRRDVKVESVKGRGPGGQHRNKTETGVHVTHLPTGIVVLATERRSRAQNLSVALDRLEARLERLRRKRKPRKKTRPTRASVERRLQDKAQRSQTKRRRRPPEGR